MSNESDGDWVKAQTPRADGEEWAQEPSEYGHSVEPDEWDDYASEQSVPVAAPQPRPSNTHDQPDAGALDSPQTVEEHDSLASPVVDVPDAEAANAPTADYTQEPPTEGYQDAPRTEDPIPATDDGVDDQYPQVQDGDPGEQYQGEQVNDPDELYREEQAHERHDGVDEPAYPDEERQAADAYNESEAEEAPLGATAASAHDGQPQEPGDVIHDGDTSPYDSHGDVRTEEYVEDVDGDTTGEDAARDELARDDWDGERIREADQPIVGDVDEEATRELLGPDPSVDADPTAGYVDDDQDMEATQAVPVTEPQGATQTAAVEHEDASDGAGVGAAAGATALGAGMAGVYRDNDSEQTRQINEDDYRTDRDRPVSDQTEVLSPAPDYDEQEAEERRLQEQLAAERQARQQRLGVVETSEENASRDTLAKPKRTTDKFFGSAGLAVLRLITAAVLGVTAYQILSDVSGAEAVLAPTMIPEPRLTAWIVGAVLGVLAIFLVLGLLQRLVGLLLMVYAIGMLAFVRWGSFNPFQENFEGFVGDKELLLAGIGFLLLTLGGGGWGIDGAFRRSRAKARAERQN